jgi:ADP-ribose pyrophosphatase
VDSRELFRFCPRCGRQSIALEGSHAIRCRHCDFLFFFNSATAVGALIPDEQGRLLLLRRAKEPAKGKYGMPGGFLDRGESAEEALMREVREEVNLEVTKCDYLCSGPNFYLYQDITYITADFFYVCQVKDWSALKALDEVLSCELVHPANIDPSEIAFDSMRAAVIEYRKRVG